jgi:uncharacterized membrane protein YfcA
VDLAVPLDPLGATLGRTLALAAVGFAAGVVNTLAGGGSFVSLAVLLWLGVPATVANGSNRVAVLVQSLGAWATFRGEAAVTRGEAAVTVTGALLGASVAVVVPPEALEKVLSAAMLALVGFAMARPAAFAEPGPPSRWRWPGLFLVAAYGGFAQAGIGLLLVPLLVRTAGVDAVRANAKKVVLVALVSVPSLLTFLAAGQVDAAVGASLAVGGLLGGVAGARLTTWLGPVWVWRVLLAMTVVTAIRAFWPTS